MVTIRDVAGESGFSVTTVSMVLNAGPGSARISARTRTRIWKVAQRMGYRPNLYARSLRSRRTHTLGVMVFDLTDPYCTQILRGIQNHLRASGLFPIVTDSAGRWFSVSAVPRHVVRTARGRNYRYRQSSLS